MLKKIKKLVMAFLRSRNYQIVYYGHLDRPKIFRLIRKIKSEVKMILQYNEAYNVYMAAKNTSKIDGCIAEVGVFQGGSAKLIAHAVKDKDIFLFDTFEGLPEDSVFDSSLGKGMMYASFQNVSRYLKDYKNVHILKGVFPDTSDCIRDKRFSFVNLDVDLHDSTKVCLEFFYPRMNKGGVIISHDYSVLRGVKKAVDDFFCNKPEPIIELAGSQCLIVKV